VADITPARKRARNPSGYSAHSRLKSTSVSKRYIAQTPASDCPS